MINIVNIESGIITTEKSKKRTMPAEPHKGIILAKCKRQGDQRIGKWAMGRVRVITHWRNKAIPTETARKHLMIAM
jgi:hypothetical protein